ncbi:uncharacterized protein LOC122871305 [Siniperca chuatsi]|uniref:uncharacterized protein LOC122871305 n=1 Tax=Siniperca chuatsi TaxID=119488 RepID=UPI001CE1825D|nr:uncharacterized protein LOC122871305 [Siniperca chuatsi]
MGRCVLRYVLDSCLSGPPTCFHSTAVAPGFIAMEINHGYKHPAGHVQVPHRTHGGTTYLLRDLQLGFLPSCLEHEIPPSRTEMVLRRAVVQSGQEAAVIQRRLGMAAAAIQPGQEAAAIQRRLGMAAAAIQLGQEAAAIQPVKEATAIQRRQWIGAAAIQPGKEATAIQRRQGIGAAAIQPGKEATAIQRRQWFGAAAIQLRLRSLT